jgi:CubicO group peptidase (beta-lactamase class C family)
MPEPQSDDRLGSFLRRLVDEGDVLSAVALVGRVGGEEHAAVAGEARPGVAAGLETRFDYASLTKPYVATVALRLDAEGRLPLATQVGEIWPGAHAELAAKTLEDLLRHRAGVAAWTPLYVRCGSIEEALALILGGGEGGDLLGAPPGSYSDLGFLLAGAMLERSTGEPLARLVRGYVLDPLGLHDIEATPGDRPGIAVSRMGTGQEVLLAAKQGREIADLGPPEAGTPQDGNARFLIARGFGAAPLSISPRIQPTPAPGGEALAPTDSLSGASFSRNLAGEGLDPISTVGGGSLPPGRGWVGNGGRIGGGPAPHSGKWIAGGLAPHSGLFGSASSLYRLAQEWLAPGLLLDPEAVRRALASDAIGFHLGWWRWSPVESAGPGLSPAAFGHTGFAGGSLWIDPQAPGGGRIYTLLGSRIDPLKDFNRRRREFHLLAAGL